MNCSNLNFSFTFAKERPQNVNMSVVAQSCLFVLTLLVAAGEAKSIGSRNPTPIASYTPGTEVLFFLQLLKDDRVRQYDSPKSHLLLVVQPEAGGGKDLTISDPNILLMVENFQSSHQWADESGKSPRLTRDMSSDSSDPPYMEMGTSRGNYFDLWLVPRRNLPNDQVPPSASLIPPPLHAPATPSKQQQAESGATKNGNRVSGRSISSAHMSPNHSDHSDDDPPDFLSTLVTIPQVWMHDLSHMIIQPLRKPTSGERDSFEYFGMVGKAPFIQCPLGFKKSSLGNIIFF